MRGRRNSQTAVAHLLLPFQKMKALATMNAINAKRPVIFALNDVV
jgi:hypothetical protein